MTPEQQSVFEYMLPLVLPGIMYCGNMSHLGHGLALLVVVCHAIECMCTNFGGGFYVVDWIGPIQHLQWDMILNHAMISAFFFCGPDYFGPNCYMVGLCLVPTLPTVLAVDLKSHFLAYVLTEDEKTTPSDPTSKLLKLRLGQHIFRSTFLYLGMIILLALSSFYGNGTTQTLAIFAFNLCPIIVDLSYWKEFAFRVEPLPVKHRTALHQRHVDLLLQRPSSSQRYRKNRIGENEKGVKRKLA
jgi:hypothetical protein